MKRGQYLWVPLTPAEHAQRARVRRTRARAKGSRPAYLSREACLAQWPGYVPTMRWVEGKR